MEKALDIVIISDVHLGTYGCHATELLKYLRSVNPKILILNGDFIDIWQFKKSYFPKEHMEIINEVIRKSMSGSKVYYITGNHDDLLRNFSECAAGGIHLRDKLVLQLHDKKHWIFHGDIFDASIKLSPFIAKMGGKGYDFLIRINRFINKMRHLLGYPRMSFAHRIKTQVKSAVTYISDFEKTAIDLALDNKYDYVICGHIHIPQIKEISTDKGKVIYMNSGDWVENLTALEYNYGKWRIYEYDEMDYVQVSKRLQVKKTLTKTELTLNNILPEIQPNLKKQP